MIIISIRIFMSWPFSWITEAGVTGSAINAEVSRVSWASWSSCATNEAAATAPMPTKPSHLLNHSVTVDL